jgi:hypothetical protein
MTVSYRGQSLTITTPTLEACQAAYRVLTQKAA